MVISDNTAPAFQRNIDLILLFRGLLGFGMEILIPLQIAYFADYREDICTILLGVNGLLCSFVFLLIL